jgi:hypothetical protein
MYETTASTVPLCYMIIGFLVFNCIVAAVNITDEYGYHSVTKGDGPSWPEVILTSVAAWPGLVYFYFVYR